MAPVSVKKSRRGEFAVPVCSPAARLRGLGEFLLIIMKGICSTAYCSVPLDEQCSVGAWMFVCDGSRVPLRDAHVGLNKADFNGCLNEVPGP